MLQSLLVTLHLALCVAIVALVLIQRGKGADAGAGFGAGASGTVFGARGSATFFSKATAVVATLFFVTSLALTYLASQPVEAPDSLVESLTEQAPQTAPPAPESLGADEVPAIGGEALPGVGADPGMGADEVPAIVGEDAPAQQPEGQ